MGVLIKDTNNEEFNLLRTDSCFSIDSEFYTSLYEIDSLYKRLVQLKQEYINFNNDIEESSKEKERLIHEYDNIISEINRLLGEKKQLLANPLKDCKKIGLREIESQFKNLLSKQEKIGDQLKLNNIKLQQNSKRIDYSLNEYKEKLEMYSKLKQYFLTEYHKINWDDLLEESNVTLSPIFNQIDNVELRTILVKITLKNYEIEREMINIIEHNITQFLDKDCCKDIDLFTESIQFLLDFINEIYNLVFDYIKTEKVNKESLANLEITLNLLDYILCLTKKFFVCKKDESLTELVTMKIKVELNNTIVLKKYRPACLFKKEIASYNSKKEILKEVLWLADNYLSKLDCLDNVKQKTYSFHY